MWELFGVRGEWLHITLHTSLIGPIKDIYRSRFRGFYNGFLCLAFGEHLTQGKSERFGTQMIWRIIVVKC